VGINWSGKRRWIALLLLIAGIVVMLTVPPVIPVIQLPGEVYPNGATLPILNTPITNTFVSSVIVWILLILLALYVSRRRPRSGGEVPPGGFYNMFEMAFEGLMGFIENIAAGPYFNVIFKIFMTIFLIVLLSNWQSLIPGVDSIGFLHEHVHVDPETGHEEVLDGYEAVPWILGTWRLNPKCPWVSPEEAATLTEETMQARREAGCVTGTGQPVPAAESQEHEGEEAVGSETEETATGGAATGQQAAEDLEGDAVEEEAVIPEAAEGEETEAAAEEEHEVVHHAPGDPSVPWVVTPFFRPPSTDLNMTLGLALVAVVMVQVMGFRALGLSYLTKFFNFRTLFTSPLGGIDVAVGLLELIGEIARILSFAFRLLGNVFAGSVLLFVMSFLLPFLPWPFFILEFFVGIIQALVFGLLAAIFMNGATASHHPEEHGEAHEGAH
jgi:F-type H+-transporting ATPase subunit a